MLAFPQTWKEPMEIRKLKSLSIEQLEQAIAAAITSLTNGEADVKISLVRDTTTQTLGLTSKEQFELALVATCRTTTPEAEVDWMGEKPIGWGDFGKPGKT
jgi:hypothetical protein